jgi:hypothetical protein
MKKQCVQSCISTNANGVVTREKKDMKRVTRSRIFCFTAFGDRGTRSSIPNTLFRKKGCIMPIGPRSCSSLPPQFLHSLTQFPPEFRELALPRWLSELFESAQEEHYLCTEANQRDEVLTTARHSAFVLLKEEHLPGRINFFHLLADSIPSH